MKKEDLLIRVRVFWSRVCKEGVTRVYPGFFLTSRAEPHASRDGFTLSFTALDLATAIDEGTYVPKRIEAFDQHRSLTPCPRLITVS